MVEYVISERAAHDLREIADYTEKNWSEEHNPLVGRSYDDYRIGLRGYSCGKHVVLYRLLSELKVRVVRVLHGRMDFSKHN